MYNVLYNSLTDEYLNNISPNYDTVEWTDVLSILGGGVCISKNTISLISDMFSNGNYIVVRSYKPIIDAVLSVGVDHIWFGSIIGIGDTLSIDYSKEFVHWCDLQ